MKDIIRVKPRDCEKDRDTKMFTIWFQYFLHSGRMYTRLIQQTTDHFIHFLFLLRRVDHELRPNVLVEVLLANDLELHGALLESNSFLVRVLGGLAG